MDCALRVAGEMEHADEFHATFGMSSEEIYANPRPTCREVLSFQLYKNFMTHAEGDYEIGSSYSMAANFTFGHFTRNLCVNLACENCVLEMKQADFIECERNGGDSTVVTTQR